MITGNLQGIGTMTIRLIKGVKTAALQVRLLMNDKTQVKNIVTGILLVRRAVTGFHCQEENM